MPAVNSKPQMESVSLESLLVKLMRAGLISKNPVHRAGDVCIMVDFAEKATAEGVSLDVLLLCECFLHIAGGPLTQVSLYNAFIQHLQFLKEWKVFDASSDEATNFEAIVR